ncbi:MAG: glycine cleavage T C-terminal barrel domain-containing protein [Anaerolineae bacterium]|nr:glycine cleavage T C-terminal barrel domain-containing protein [Anaerolineae bacterium]
MSAVFPADYQAAHEGAVWFCPPEPGFLRLGGEDRLDFLQRQSTNDLRRLRPDRHVVTVLTSPTARILDVLTVFDLGDALGVLTLPGHGPRTARELRGKIFFMDRVTVSDHSREWAQLDLEGPQAAAVLQRLGLTAVPTAEGVAMFVVAGCETRVLGQRGLRGVGFRLLMPAEGREAVTTALAAADAVPLSAEVHDVLRVEAGLPGMAELTEEYNPLEANLDAFVAENKGCYTGQEVIARQITYDKVTRRLVGLRPEAPVPVGAEVLAEGRTVGQVTSAALSPRLGPLALAYIKRPFHQPDTRLLLRHDGQETPAVVVALPYTS